MVSIKKISYLSILLIALFINSCSNSNGQTQKTNLSANEFSDKIQQLPSAPIVDVRTPEEFSNGHLVNAVNIDWRGTTFQDQINSLDKSKPVFVYCLSGGRSSSAANKMREEGFKEVYELDGGIMKWRAAKLPETTDNKKSSGMTVLEFEQLLNSDKLVLVDFYAEWCAPCKKMKPYLDEISKEMADKVTVVRIDADTNQELLSYLKVDALPTLIIYKNKNSIWKNVGYISKEQLVEHLN